MRNVVFLPGFMCDEDLWADIKPGFAGLGRPYFGDYGTGETFTEMATNVLKSAPAHFSLIGFSMGGYVAREMALQAAERIEALVLIGISARGDDPDKTLQKEGLVKLTRRSSFRGLSRLACKTSLHPERMDNDDLLDRVQAMALRVGKEAFMRQLLLFRSDSHDKLKDIQTPTLVIAARQDQLRSIEEANELASGIPDAKLAIIENCGHMIPMEQPGPLLDVITEWLDRERD